MNDKHKILVADSDESNLTVLARILSPAYLLITASGESVLQRVAEEPPHLILLSAAIRGANALDILAGLKKKHETRHIPVIFVTEPGGDDDEEKALTIGAADCVTKPFRNAIVRNRVRTQIQLMRQIHMLEQVGLTDPLTDIPNRRNFDLHMSIEWRRAFREKKEFSLLIMNIDRFKEYNDVYGYPQGDALLKALSKIFVTAAKRAADMAARLGGEEFAVLLPDTGLDGAAAIAEGIRAAVEAVKIPTADEHAMTSATISIGVAVWSPEEGGTSQEFIARAKKNLAAAKNAGRNTVEAS